MEWKSIKKNWCCFWLYENNSITNVGRNRHSSGELSMQKLLRNMEIKKWSALLSWNGNKNKLVDFIVKQWVSSSSLIGYKILIVANNKEAYEIESNNCILIPELENNHKEADTNVFMTALSKIMEFNCKFYLKTSTKSHEGIIDINEVAQYVNHNINETDCNKYTFLKALFALSCIRGCGSNRSVSGKSKSKSLSLITSNENYLRF